MSKEDIAEQDMFCIKQQVVEDASSGLILEFSVKSTHHPKSSLVGMKTYKLRICGGNLPFGNRDILFDQDGTVAARGTYVAVR